MESTIDLIFEQVMQDNYDKQFVELLDKCNDKAKFYELIETILTRKEIITNFLKELVNSKNFYKFFRISNLDNITLTKYINILNKLPLHHRYLFLFYLSPVEQLNEICKEFKCEENKISLVISLHVGLKKLINNPSANEKFYRYISYTSNQVYPILIKLYNLITGQEIELPKVPSLGVLPKLFTQSINLKFVKIWRKLIYTYWINTGKTNLSVHLANRTYTPKLIIMQGLPGSGKTATALKKYGKKYIYVSSDSFFYDKNGIYKFVKELYYKNQTKTQELVLKLMLQGKNIVIDNPNLTTKEYDIYVFLAMLLSYEIVFDPIKCDINKVHEYHINSRNNVPKNILERMCKRYIHCIKNNNVQQNDENDVRNINNKKLSENNK